MLYHASELRRCDIRATDGSIGDVHDLYFDDRFWTLRYFVVDTGNWLPGRKVLVAPEAVVSVDTEKKAVTVELTKTEVEDAPDMSSDLPVSRQMETALRQRYGWPEYWDMAAAGVAAPPMIPPFVPEETLQGSDPKEDYDSDPNLRSVREIEGYGLSTTDDEIGKVDDLLVDGDGWVIRYMVVKTGGWLSGRNVLIAPPWCQGISWSQRVLDLALSRESIESCPEYDPAMPITREYETRIHQHYRHEAYWSEH